MGAIKLRIFFALYRATAPETADATQVEFKQRTAVVLFSQKIDESRRNFSVSSKVSAENKDFRFCQKAKQEVDIFSFPTEVSEESKNFSAHIKARRRCAKIIQ